MRSLTETAEIINPIMIQVNDVALEILAKITAPWNIGHSHLELVWIHLQCHPKLINHSKKGNQWNSVWGIG